MISVITSYSIHYTKLYEENSGGGDVVVFDDVTNLIAAQRTAAWGEVARRLAHEIKNPLTPIQLSAERLQFKLADPTDPVERLQYLFCRLYLANDILTKVDRASMYIV